MPEVRDIYEAIIRGQDKVRQRAETAERERQIERERIRNLWLTREELVCQALPDLVRPYMVSLLRDERVLENEPKDVATHDVQIEIAGLAPIYMRVVVKDNVGACIVSMDKYSPNGIYLVPAVIRDFEFGVMFHFRNGRYTSDLEVALAWAKDAWEEREVMLAQEAEWKQRATAVEPVYEDAEQPPLISELTSLIRIIASEEIQKHQS